MTHFAEPWSYRPPQVDLAQLEKIREAAIALLGSVEFKMSGTLDTARRVIDYGTSKHLHALYDAVYPRTQKEESCNMNSIESPSLNNVTESKEPVTLLVGQ